MSKLYEAQWAAWKTYLWLQSIFDSQKPGEITRNLRTRAHSQSCTEIYLLAENMAETDSDAMLEALRDLPNKAAAAWPTRMLQGPRDREDSTPEATITQVALTRLWQEINETPELIEALFIFGDPQSCKSCFEVTTLAYKEILGYFPTARTITIATLDTAGTFYMALVVRGQNTLLDPTIAFGIQAVLLRSEDDKKLPSRLYMLGILLGLRAEIRNAREDFDQAIACTTRAIHLHHIEDKERLAMLKALGEVYVARFKRYKETHDIDSAIEHQKQAISLIGDSVKTNHPIQFDLGHSYALRFESSGTLEDLNEAIQHQILGLDVAPVNHVYRPNMLDEHGSLYRDRFKLLGTLEDIQKAIDLGSQAVSLLPEGHTNKPGWLDNLGSSYQCRFGRLGELADINQAIVCRSKAVSLTPHGHPIKSQRLNNLGNSYHRRFEHFGEVADIDRAIECKSEAVSLTPDEHAIKSTFLNNLGSSYHRRFECHGELADIEQAIECQTKALSLAPDGGANKAGQLSNLGISYQSRFERLGELKDIDRAIECQTEAVSLTADGQADAPGRLSNLGISYQSRFERLGELKDIDQSVVCLSEAVSLTPHGHPDKARRLNNLGNSYHRRFGHFGQLVDIDRAITRQTEAVSLTLDGHAIKPGLLNNLSSSYQSRFERLGELKDIDRAITCQTEAVTRTPDGHADKPGRLLNLGSFYQSRFEFLGKLADIDRAIAHQVEAVSLTPDGHADIPGRLGDLGISYKSRFEYLGELESIEQAIACQTKAVSLAPDGHTEKPGWFGNLGNSYQRRFERFGELNDINQAIACQKEAVSLTQDGHVDEAGWLGSLGFSYRTRFKHSSELSDLDQAVSFLQMAAHSPVGKAFIAFRASRQWAALALASNHPTTLQAYRQAMALVPKVIWIGSTINSRYSDMHSIGAIAVEAAAFAISIRDYGLALEWLEAGRSIVWTQTLQLRSQFDDLSTVSPTLAQSLKKVAQELELTGHRDTAVTLSDSQALEAIAQTHRRLAEKYENNLVEARKLPGFQDFMRPKRVVDLLPAAQSGPVVVVNVYSSRSDALIIHPCKEDISHVPLPDLSNSDVTTLQCQIQGLLGVSRSGGRRPEFRDPPTNNFGDILTVLWHKIVNPVLVSLEYMKATPVDPLPHITWCTTGALSFLPIHAAGCYDEAGPKIFDFVVSSYTPTLGALLSIQSRSLDVGKILAVSQEDSLPKTKDELAYIRRHAKGVQYMQLEKDQATPQNVLDAMAECDCIHIACHGLQNVHKPTESYFALHQGNLTLSEITKKSLKNKGLAFLSACQTATGDAKMPDEAVHLAAGMLIAGYPTVIATMWSIEDEDAPLVADKVYGELLKDGRLDGGRAARALHAAVKELRKEIGEAKFYRWVPYIHLGI